MEMDQISLQTLDRASIDIRRTLLHLSRSLGLLIPLLLRAKAHTLAHTKGHDSTLRLSFIPAAPSPPRLSHTSFLSTLCSRLTSASPPPLQNSPVTGRIHQVSAKYRNPLLSLSLSATFLLVSPYTFVPYVRNDHANGSILRMGERGMDGWISSPSRRTQVFFSQISRSFYFFDRIVRNTTGIIRDSERGDENSPFVEISINSPIWLRTANISFFASAGELLGHETAKTAISRLDRMGDTLERDYASWPR